ncbi:MAG: adenosylcobinamide-phosphate synthase CbiB [Roseobacter sp.]
MMAALLVLAMVVDAVLGEPKWLWSKLPHPAVLMGRVVGQLDARLNQGAHKKAKGCIAVSVLVVLGATLGALLTMLGPVAQVICAAILLAHKSLIEHVQAVAVSMRTDTEAGRRAVAMIVSRDTSQMDASQVARAAIESGAENLSDGVIAPAFWFLCAGLPGLIIYKMVNTADSMIGYRTPKHQDFGWAAARLDDLLNLIPARMTAVLIALPARYWNGKAIYHDARLHRSPNAGWPEAAMARALHIALSGPRSYDGTLRDFPWVNADGRHALSATDVDTCISMLWKAWSVMVFFVTLTAVLTI